MKSFLSFSTWLFLLGVANAWAAAAIGLNNYGLGANPIYYDLGVLAPMTGTYVELIANGHPVNDTATGSSLIPMSEDGFFFGGVGIVPNLADNGTAVFTLRAWRGPLNFFESTERGSVTWTQATGSWNPNAMPPTPPMAVDLMNPPFTLLIPEPSTIALCLIGGAAMLLFRRKG